MKIIFATQNPGKTVEINRIMEDLHIDVLTMGQAGFHPEIDENGSSFIENALIKVRAVGPQPDAIIMSDDSGICIDAMDGGPGIFSARYLGEKTSYEEKLPIILDSLRDVPDEKRGAHYTCAVAMLFPDGSEEVVEEYMYGTICREMRGTGGFGYDPIFYLPEAGMTTAELGSDKKNEISHRGKALRKAKEIIIRKLEK